MKSMLTGLAALGAVVGPAVAQADEVTATVAGRPMTYVATPSAPSVQLSKEDILSIASKAKPLRPNVPIDPKAKVPTLK